MTLAELQQVYESLTELTPDVEDFSWGPSYELALRRKKAAQQILKRAILEAKSKEQ
jgi:hypothetical protein